jgi:hypothetical protein
MAFEQFMYDGFGTQPYECTFPSFHDIAMKLRFDTLNYNCEVSENVRWGAYEFNVHNSQDYIISESRDIEGSDKRQSKRLSKYYPRS